ncbi:MAG: hypothetical protein U0807_07880 [Candidatus Binatia bacterium]
MQNIKLFATFVLVLVAGPAAAQVTTTTTTLPNSAGSICKTGTPATQCVVDQALAFSSPTLLDIPTRTLIVTRRGTIDVGTASLIVNAAGVDIQPGGDLLAGGGRIDITAAGDVAIESTADGRTVAKIDVSGDSIAGTSGGTLAVIAGGAITVDGNLKARGPGEFADGGTIGLSAAGAVAISGLGKDTIDASSGVNGTGGEIDLSSSAGDITLDRALDVSGGDSDGGTIDIDAKGSIVLSESLDVSGGGASGSGGYVTFTADGDVTIGDGVGNDLMEGAGASSDMGGDGAEIDIVAGGTLRVNAQAHLMSGSPDGTGGTVDWEAGGDVIVTQQIKANGSGAESCGGDVFLQGGDPIMGTAGDLTLGALVDVSAGDCGGGTVDAEATARLAANAEIDGNNGNGATSGADIALVGEQVAVATGITIHSDGGVSAHGGTVTLQGCTVQVPAGATLSTLGSGGANLLQGGGLIRVAGTLMAGTKNQIGYRTLAPNLTGGILTPAAVVGQDMTIAPCNSSTTTTTTLVTTTTSSTVVSTTTVPPATTTSTTLAAACHTDDQCPASNACTVGRCAGGSCVQEEVAGADAVRCRLDAITAELDGAPAGAIKTPALAKSLRRRVTTAQHLFGIANGLTGRKRIVKLGKARVQLTGLGKALRKGKGKTIADDLAGRMLPLVDGAVGKLGALMT